MGKSSAQSRCLPAAALILSWAFMMYAHPLTHFMALKRELKRSPVQIAVHHPAAVAPLASVDPADEVCNYCQTAGHTLSTLQAPDILGPVCASPLVLGSDSRRSPSKSVGQDSPRAPPVTLG